MSGTAMSRGALFAVIVGSAGWVAFGWFGPLAQGQTGAEGVQARAVAQAQPKDKDRDLQTFMRMKLTASEQILEGLCQDDMALVIKGARQLHDMSDAERWRVSNDIVYKQFSDEFRQTTSDLMKAAEEKNPDRVLIKWIDATVSCMDCHRFVRGMRIAGN